ncbi:MAG TPA: NAD-dependent epimerase/dehydratase family protein [Ktedonobacteraceae bacterium]|jgi:nucleoside-diphosphate-sugar epimerase
MEILITGGNGFLGRNLVLALQERGDNIRVIALPTEDTAWLEERNVKVFRGNIVDPHMLVEPMRGVDGVIHLAAMIGAWRAMKDYYVVNVTGTENVCRAALKAGVHRLVHISSAMVYDMAMGRPVTEDDPLKPLDEPYSWTKAQGDILVERMIREEHLPAVIVRPGTLVGPGDRLNFGRMADRVRAGKGIIIGSGNNAIPLVYITDLVQGLLLALDSEQAVGKIYNISNDLPLTQEQYLSIIAQEIGVAPPRIHVPYHLLYTAAYTAERIAVLSKDRILPFLTRHGVKLYGANNLVSIDKAHRELGFSPKVPISEAVRIACAWYLRPKDWTFGPMSGNILQETRAD